MNIPISLSYKYFSETITVKKKVDSLNISDTLDMYKSIIVPIYGEEYYERAMVSLAQQILEKWEKTRPVVFEIKPPKPEDLYIKV